MPTRRSILFVCTANSARSQMAAAYLKTRLTDNVQVRSAGTRPKPVHPMTIRVMKELGIKVAGGKGTSIDDLRKDERFTYVIIVCGAAERECPKSFSPSSVRYVWPFDDPSEVVMDDEALLARFRRVRDQIIQQIDRWVHDEIPEHWRKHGDGKHNPNGEPRHDKNRSL